MAKLKAQQQESSQQRPLWDQTESHGQAQWEGEMYTSYKSSEEIVNIFEQ